VTSFSSLFFWGGWCLLPHLGSEWEGALQGPRGDSWVALHYAAVPLGFVCVCLKLSFCFFLFFILRCPAAPPGPSSASPFSWGTVRWLICWVRVPSQAPPRQLALGQYTLQKCTVHCTIQYSIVIMWGAPWVAVPVTLGGPASLWCAVSGPQGAGTGRTCYLWWR